MLFFELFPAFVMLLLVPVGIWLYARDREARRREASEQTTRCGHCDQ
jgi:hypothetical protein